MYCAGCGNSINADLNYCKSCGTRLLSAEKPEIGSRILTVLTITFGVTTIVGLGVLIALIAMLLDRGAAEQVLVMTIALYLLAFTGIEFILGSQISKLINASVGKTEKNKKIAPQTVQPAQLFAPNTAQLPEPAHMPASVTEHTTRFFDKVSRTKN